MNQMIERIGQLGIVPVVAIEDAKDAEQLGSALLGGGLPCAEITFRTKAAQESIAIISNKFPEMIVGAGTVLTIEQAVQAKVSGAKFIVTPGFDDDVVNWCLSNNLPVTPGVITPTEINMALKKGLTTLKFFPAEASGGIKLLKAISGPYGSVRFIPTGGINTQNLSDYLSLSNVHACGGSWMVKKQLISTGQFAEITRLTKAALEIVKTVKGG
ncbi:MAG: bifunctional 4-hydroxy-2-oxoglutarate aldolase/2-dehydro-3-deoxy-phosphogluconate aldolase [Chloroflexota bacterium]